jgi:Zn-dependent protease
MGANWRIGSLFGIPLYLDYSWFLILIFVTLINVEEINNMGLASNSVLLCWLTGLSMALLLFASVLIHELGHSLVARSQGIQVNSITLFLFGGIAAIERESHTPKEAFWVAIAGPIVSFTLFIFFFTLTQFWDSASLLHFVATDLGKINLVLAIFNLIPGLPLDGGQVLKAIVWQITGDQLTGVRWASASGQLVGWFGICFGLFIFLLTGEVAGIWLVLIGWFMLRNASAYERITLLQESLRDLIAADAMTREFRVINAHLTIRQFVEEYVISQLPTSTPITYYAASEGRYRGLLRVSELQSVERSQWDHQQLLDIVHPLNEIPSVKENTSLVEVVKQLEQVQDLRLTVLSPAEAVSGVIDRGDLVKAIATKHNLPVPDLEIKRIKEEGTYPPYLQLNVIADIIEKTGNLKS